MASGVNVQLSIEFKGLGTMERNLLGMQSRVAQAAADALYEQAKGIMDKSIEQVPVDTGTLKASAYVERPTVTNTQITIDFGYGGPNDQVNPKSGQRASEYAIFVHERLDVHHTVGKAKYLEDPLNDAIRDMDSKLASKVKVDIGW